MPRKIPRAFMNPLKALAKRQMCLQALSGNRPET